MVHLLNRHLSEHMSRTLARQRRAPSAGKATVLPGRTPRWLDRDLPGSVFAPTALASLGGSFRSSHGNPTCIGKVLDPVCELPRAQRDCPLLEPSAKAIALDAYWERLADRSPVGHRASDVVYYLLFYEVVDDYVERRRAFREEHLGLARDAKERGELLLAGAFADPPDGAALVFRAEDDSVVREFVARDPYVREGLVKSWAIREWTVVVGDQ